SFFHGGGHRPPFSAPGRVFDRPRAFTACMSLFAETLQQSLSRHPPASRYWIAYSGGLDSQVLLHLCAKLKARRPDLQFAAVHIHHGLQAAADEWAETCEATSRMLGIPFQLLRVTAVAKHGE